MGIFVEPASAASVAGLLTHAGAGLVPPGARVVCTVTGHGLKDTATALGQREVDPPVIEARTGAAARMLGLA